MQTSRFVLLGLVLAATLATSVAQPFQPGTGYAPLGNLRTTDKAGPYNISLLEVQQVGIRAGLAARQDYTDQDIVEFLTHVECLEGQFDTWGTFGMGFIANLSLGGPVPIGAKAANLSDSTRPFLQEVALNEQGHALFTRHAGSALPCPAIDFLEGFNGLMALAYNLSWSVDSNVSAQTAVQQAFGAPFDPFLNDQCYVLSVLSLEELGATGNKGLALLASNPVIANGIAGLATSANSQATIERMLLWQLRNLTIFPFNETAQQVFARISVVRDTLDGPIVLDQGLTNTDPRNIAVPFGYVNMVNTDYRGLTLDRTPQQVIHITTLGSTNSKGGFFPNGFAGRINSSAGYDIIANATDATLDFPNVCNNESSGANCNIVDFQAALEQIGMIQPPITVDSPVNQTQVEVLTQSLSGPYDNQTIYTRGYVFPDPPYGMVNNGTNVTAAVATKSDTVECSS